MTFLDQETLRSADPVTDEGTSARPPFQARLVVDIAVVLGCIALGVLVGMLDVWWVSGLLAIVAVAGLLDFVLVTGPRRFRWRELTTDRGTDTA